MSGLAGTAIWLTGASSGIGEALANELARRGAQLAITARRAERLEEIAARHPGRGVLTRAGDITDREAMHRIADDLRERWGRIDLTVFNAGTYEPVTPDTFSADLFREHLEVNFMGTVHCIEAVLQGMRRRRAGRIAVVASVTGYAALPKAEAYGATKAALISMCDSLRADLAPDGVAVTVIAPGFVRTPLTSQNEFRMPFLIEPEEAARRIADGLEAGKDEIAFPLRMALAMKTLGMLPGPIARRYVAGVAGRRRTEGT